MTQKILLADDSVTIQKVIELTFMDEDYEVTTAGDGEQALERLDAMTPDVVIADVHMPGASGFDVAKRAKQLNPATPVLLLVGTFEPFDEDDYAASGADSYLKKPFDSQELLQRVDELLRSAPEVGDATSSEMAEDSADYGLDDFSVPPPPADDAEVGGWASAPTQPAPSPAAAAALGTEVSEDAGAEDPFPDLAAPSGGGVRDDDIFSSLGEADGSSQVVPPPDLDAYDDDVVMAVDDDDLEADEPAWRTEPEEVPAFDDELDAVPDDEPSYATSYGGEVSRAEEPPAMPAPGAGTVAVDASAWRNGTELAAGAGLSDEDVDRIARRVAELLGGDAVREVAWEVVPDLAEVVIKDRLRELENQVD